METKMSGVEIGYSARGVPTYSIKLEHAGLNKVRFIKCNDSDILAAKAAMQAVEWDERWRVLSEKDKLRRNKLAGKQYVESQKELATQRTEEALTELNGLETLLANALKRDSRLDWDAIKDRSQFADPKPSVSQWPVRPQSPAEEAEPKLSDPKYQAKLGLLDKIISARGQRLKDEYRQRFERDHQSWVDTRNSRRIQYEAATRVHDEDVKRLEFDLNTRLAAWDAARSAFIQKQADHNASIDSLRSGYEASDFTAVAKYVDLVLARSVYPDFIPMEFDIEYAGETKTVVIDYMLPSPDDLPTLKAVKYVANRDEFEEQHVSEAQASKAFDSVLYQVALRTVHEVFTSDTVSAIDSAVFNGYVTSTDRGTGKQVTACVLSLQVRKAEFKEINLSQVDPKTCFKGLKGVSAAKLHGLSPIAPIMQMTREDRRFVDSHAVVDTLNEGVNLAAMDWQEFEHLIREVFEKEFSASGGEVRVTQASRDGGVDAVVFDPDPIRGGKIVIQAKRYTNTVNVSAVRDLYGTVMNEGAMKGILVTTSDYGPDAYAFVADKPLVLLSGANLLHMLDKHGHKARIDIREAKLLTAGQ